jgi:hypothetical protein
MRRHGGWRSQSSQRVRLPKDGARKAIDIWTRTISFENHNDRAALHIVQRWDEVDGGVVLIQDSWFELKTFVPLTHIRHREKDGQITIKGYQFTSDKVIGIKDLADNSAGDFVMNLPEPAYNFEYDMELLQTLPLKSGIEFDIPFYDAGIDKKPDRYNFRVGGEDRTTGPDGRAINCWLVTADYHTGKVVSRF